MRSVSIIILLLLATVFVRAQQSRPNVFLSGKIVNFNNQAVLEDMSDLQYLRSASESVIIVGDTAGNFTASFYLAQPNWFRLGRNQLYLSPGDSLVLEVNRDNPRLASFRGKSAHINDFLKGTPFPKSGSFLSTRELATGSIEEAIAQIETAANYRKAQLDSLQNITEHFRELETARIKADWINSFHSLAVYGVMMKKLKDDSATAYKEQVKKLTDPIVKQKAKGFLNPAFMKIPVYRDVVSTIIKTEGTAEEKRPIEDWFNANALINEIRKQSDKDSLRAFRSRIEALETDEYKELTNRYLQNLLRFGKGDPAISFVSKDSLGIDRDLKILKGKIIYIDLWATWCGPCLAEMPYFEELKKKYKDNKDIVFVSLSIDDSETAWRRSLRARNADGIQWIIRRSDLVDYDIVTIPRTIVINRDFTIADINAPEPSSKKTIPMIDALLKKK